MRREVLAAAAALVSLFATAPAASAAEAFYGITLNNQLVTFQSDSPQAIRSSVRLAGLGAKESIVALDVRPNGGGQLYGLSSTSRIFVIHPGSGQARPVGSAFTPALTGKSFGFDFNPVADRLRITSDIGQNLRVNPDTGRGEGDDGKLTYRAGDPGAGTQPEIVGAAYTNTSAPPGGTQLFGIDARRNALVRQDPPNAGTLTTVGPLGRDLGDPVGFDIAGDGRAFLSAGVKGVVDLFLVNLSTGRATPASKQLSTALGNRGVSGTQVRAIAAAGAVPDDTRRPALVVSLGSSEAASRLARAFTVPFSCSEWCLVEGTLTARGGTVLARINGQLREAGRETLTVTPTPKGRLASRAGRSVNGLLRVRARDAGGNLSRVRQRVSLR